MAYKIIKKGKTKNNTEYIYGEFSDKTGFYADDSGRLFSDRKVTNEEALKISKELK